MKRTVLWVVALVVLVGILYFAAQGGGKNLSDYKKIIENHNLVGVIVPGTNQELDSLQMDLLSLKAVAKSQARNPQTDALLAVIDWQLVAIEMQRNLLSANEEASHIDYYNPSCTKETSLKKTIDYLDTAISKAELASAKISDFSNNYKDFVQASGINIAQTKSIIDSYKQSLADKKEKYLLFCG